jgi:hypothetical protein
VNNKQQEGTSVPNYTLNIDLTKEQVDTFHLTGQNVVIAKPTQGGASNVAWQVFRPLEGNHVKWEEQYGIYASTAKIENGAELTQLSQTPYPAMASKTYPFLPSGTFGPPAGNGGKGTYYSANSYAELQYLTFGLFQAASVNGTKVPGNAISAAPVLLGADVEMTPYTTLYVWLQSQVLSNTVVTRVSTPKTEVVFGASATEISLSYDNAGHFVPQADLELPEGAAVSTQIPAVF